MEKSAIDEIIKEVIKTGGVKYKTSQGRSRKILLPCCFKIEGKYYGQTGMPIVDVPNYELFREKLGDYLVKARDFYAYYSVLLADSDKEYERLLFAYLFFNMDLNDLENVCDFLDKRTQMLNGIDFKRVQSMGKFRDCYVEGEVVRSGPGMEGPVGCLVKLRDKELAKFHIVFYGIENDKVHIFGIQNPFHKSWRNEANKKYDRLFRKLNKGIDEEDELHKVTPTALATLTFFMANMKKQGYKEFYAHDFMPIRYYSNEENLKSEDEETREELSEEHDEIQGNITDKFIRTLYRFAHHFDNYKIETLPSGEVHIVQIKDAPTKKDDNIIYEIYESADKGDDLEPI